MPRTKISEFSSTPADNTDIDGINIGEGMLPSDVNNSIRELMAQLKDFQTGAGGDSFNGPIGSTTAVAGNFTSITDSGNLTFTGTGNRITGDFSNGTVANRVGFQSSTGTFTSVSVLGPNASQSASIDLILGNDATNTSRFHLLSSTVDARLSAGIYGTGTYVPMTFFTGGSERLRIDTSGNVGIGTSSPNGPLDVNATTPRVVLSTSGTARGQINIAGSAMNITVNDNTYPLTFNTGGGERMRITSSGGISFGSSGTAFGTSGQILMSNGNAAPTWVSSGDATANVGYLNIPQNSQSAAYTLVLADAGKHILHPSADTTARTFTIPANSSVAFPVGTAVTFINQNGAGVITIAITTDTMRLAGAGTTGSRTLAANGVATAIKITSTEWIISGTGLT